MSSLFDESLESKVSLENEATPLPEDLPFHILMIGDWAGNGDFASKQLFQRKPVEIDRDNFDDVIRKISPQISLVFDESNSSELRLTFNSLDDFHPDSIFQRISLFSELREIRQKLKKSDTFDEAAREVRSWYLDSTEKTESQTEISQPEASTSFFDPENLLDQILSNKQDDFSVKSNTSKSPLSDFIGNIIAPHIVKTDLEEQSRLLAVVDEIISDLMRKILHRKDFQQLESAWRGLYFLIRRVETDSQLKIFIAHLKKGELSHNLGEVNGLADSQLYKWLITDDISAAHNKFWAVVCGNYEFGSNIDDTAALVRIAKIAKIADCPFISQIDSEMFGIHSLNRMFEDNKWKVSTETSEYKLWSALRSLSESSYIGLSLPRFIGRFPYGTQTEPTEVFSFEEFNARPDHEDYLWLNPCFAYACALAGEFSSDGWEIDFNKVIDIRDLPLHIYDYEESPVIMSCAEINMTENIYNSIVEQGIMTLISFRGEDKIRLSSIRSISSESSGLKGKWN